MDTGAFKPKNIEHILNEEWTQYLSKRRSSQPSDWRHRLTGLAISGGGIRSAAFSLGVLQHLAAEKLLVFFDYLSTVSGGGYIGGSISYFLNHPAFDSRSPKYDLGRNFPYGDPDKSWYLPTPEPELCTG
jgi:predicted acylesterase/phospholipase RssA